MVPHSDSHSHSHLIRSRAVCGNRKSHLWLIVVGIVGIAHFGKFASCLDDRHSHHITRAPWHADTPGVTHDVMLCRQRHPHAMSFTSHLPSGSDISQLGWQTDSSYRTPPRHRLSMSLSSLTIHLIRCVFLFPVHWRRHSMLSVCKPSLNWTFHNDWMGDTENW